MNVALRTPMSLDEFGEWVGRLLVEDGTLAMPEIGIEVPLAELYADLDLP